MKEKKIVTDPYKVTAGKFSAFSKAFMMRLSIGDDINDFASKFVNLKKHFESSNKEAFTIELNNIYGNFWNIHQEADLDAQCLSYLVNCDDEEEGYKWLMDNFTKEELIAKVAEVKKNFLQN